MKERFRAPSYLLALGLVTSSCSSAEPPRKLFDDGHRSDFPKGLWRYTGGPHAESKNQIVLNAVDIGPNIVLNCPLPEAMRGESNIGFFAFKAGKIHSIESENGIIRVEDKDGVIWEYLHVKPWPNFKVGMKIEFGRGLGTLACLFPEGGEIKEGLHAHVSLFLKGKDGKLIPVPINGRKIGDWTVHEGETPSNGTLTRNGWEIRIADKRICIPQPQNPIPCGRDDKGRIIRNDLPNPFVEYVRP